MSQPRHKPKSGVPVSGSDGVKLKLRIPTDGSVDLDDLRRALEEQLRKPKPPEPEIIPEPEVMPETVTPQPESVSAPKTREWIAWYQNNFWFANSIFALVFTAVMGIFSLVQKMTTDSVSGIIFWPMIFGFAALATCFSVLVYRQREKISTAWIYGVGVSLAAITVIGLWAWALSTSNTKEPDTIAKNNPPSKTTPSKTDGKLPVEPPPVKPPKKGEPVAPPTQPERPVVGEASGPAPEWGARLMATGAASSILFGGLFLITRQRKKKFTDDKALQQGASLGHIQFFRALRYFIAGHGGFYLVAAMVGLLVTVIQLPVGLGSGVLLSLLTIPVAAGVVMALGYAGVNLMPTLDLKVARSHSSALVRFLGQKSLLSSVLGLTLSAIILLVKGEFLQIETWGPYVVMNSVTYGFIAALLWRKGDLVVKHESVKLPEAKAPARARTALYYNLPLWGGLTLLANFILIGITELSWSDFWWLSFITGAFLAGLVALLRCFHHLLIRCHFIIVTAGIGTFASSFIGGEEFPFWAMFVLYTVLLALGVLVTGHQFSHKEGSGRLFIVPSNKAPFEKVIETTRDGVIVQWGKFTVAVTFLLLFTATALSWVWGSN